MSMGVTMGLFMCVRCPVGMRVGLSDSVHINISLGENMLVFENELDNEDKI
jgi:hypothetical protein